MASMTVAHRNCGVRGIVTISEHSRTSGQASAGEDDSGRTPQVHIGSGRDDAGLASPGQSISGQTNSGQKSSDQAHPEQANESPPSALLRGNVQPQADQGLFCVAAVAAHFQIATDPIQLAHDLGLGGRRSTGDDLARAARPRWPARPAGRTDHDRTRQRARSSLDRPRLDRSSRAPQLRSRPAPTRATA